MTEGRRVGLWCGARVISVDASLCDMASERVFWREFLVRRAHDLEARPPGAPVFVGGSGAVALAREGEDDVASRARAERGVAVNAAGAPVSVTQGSAGAHAEDVNSAGVRAPAARGHARSAAPVAAEDADVSATAALVVERAELPGATLIQAPLGECRFERAGSTLRVQVDDGVSRGELVLRLAYYLCAVEQGAVLIHACAVRLGDVAAVASGKSGDGKSTLSRLCVGAGLTLLTDEVVMLFPDGRVCGTPFRSDYGHAGAPGLARARYFFALRKAPQEALEPLGALEAAQLATSQCFELPEVALPRAEARRRLLSFLSHVEPRTLAFRKDPAAGEFVRDRLA